MSPIIKKIKIIVIKLVNLFSELRNYWKLSLNGGVLSFTKSLIIKFQNAPDSLDEMNIILKRHRFLKNLYCNNSFLRFDIVSR